MNELFDLVVGKATQYEREQEYWYTKILPRIEECTSIEDIKNLYKSLSYECRNYANGLDGMFAVEFSFAMDKFNVVENSEYDEYLKEQLRTRNNYI